MSKFTHLESPLTVRGKVYKNRLIAAPTLFAHSVVAETKPPYVPWGSDAYVREDGVQVHALNNNGQIT